jgi:Tfp pilus assembly protein PilV
MKTLRSQRGATFIEAVASVAVFASVAIGLSPGLLSARRYAALSSSQSQATAYAQDLLEQVRARGSTACTTNASTTYGIFTRTCGVTSNSATAGVSTAVVSVTWRDRPASTPSITLVTLFN